MIDWPAAGPPLCGVTTAGMAVLPVTDSQLVTYRVSGEEMRMGVAFGELESNKAALSIEDYSVAQPTLEQVFIRTVNTYSKVQQSFSHS